MRNQPRTETKSHTPFHTGERVALGGNSGVIIAAFPDGFHLVHLDESHEVTGAHFSQLLSIDDERAEFDRGSESRGRHATPDNR